MDNGAARQTSRYQWAFSIKGKIGRLQIRQREAQPPPPCRLKLRYVGRRTSMPSRPGLRMLAQRARAGTWEAPATSVGSARLHFATSRAVHLPEAHFLRFPLRCAGSWSLELTPGT